MSKVFLFQSGISYNPNYGPAPVKQFTYKDINDGLHTSLYNKYSYAQTYYYTNKLIQILQDTGSPAIEFVYDKNYFEDKEYLVKTYNIHESTRKLKVQSQRNQLIFPRFFFEPISFELLVDKCYTRKKKLRRQIQESHQIQFNLTKQFIKKKLCTFDPILKDLETTKPTTVVMADMLQDLNTEGTKSVYFMVELERCKKQQVVIDSNQIKQFDEIVKKQQYSILSNSTKISMTRQNSMLKLNAKLSHQDSKENLYKSHNYNSNNNNININSNNNNININNHNNNNIINNNNNNNNNNKNRIDKKINRRNDNSSNCNILKKTFQLPKDITELAQQLLKPQNNLKLKPNLKIDTNIESITNSQNQFLSARLTHDKINLLKIKSTFYSPKESQKLYLINQAYGNPNPRITKRKINFNLENIGRIR